MSIPQVPSQLKRGPVVALRAVFAGVGKVLMAAEKPKPAAPVAAQANGSAKRSGQDARMAHSRASGTSEPASRWRSLDQTGNVRLLSADDLDDEDREAAAVPEVTEQQAPAVQTPGPQAYQQAPAVQTPEPQAYQQAPAVQTPEQDASATQVRAWQVPAWQVPTSQIPVSQDPDSEPVPAAPAPPELPLPSYDTLTLPSIRARLRNLDVAQLRVLVAYENANAERPEVLGMLERRIEKLETGT